MLLAKNELESATYSFMTMELCLKDNYILSIINPIITVQQAQLLLYQIHKYSPLIKCH